MKKKIFLYWNTIKYLRLKQLIYRLRRYFPRNSPSAFSTASASDIPLKWYVNRNYKKKEILNDNEILILNLKGNRREWLSSDKSLLWQYHINYFEFASDILTEQEAGLVQKDMLNWIESNTDFNKAPWDPYPTSLRIVNWIKYYLNGNPTPQKVIDSIALQASYLYRNVEYDLYGNHLFRNAKALCFAGAAIKNKESAKWLKKGEKILSREIKEQILKDGGNFELSPMYHSNIIEDMLDLVNIIRAFNLKEFSEILEEFIEILPNSISWLDKMCHPDKGVSFFNDSALKASMSLEELKSYAYLLNIKTEDTFESGTFFLEESGYAGIRNNQFNLICDTGLIGPDYMPGHSHADCLSFELSINNQRVFVNSGTSEYNNSSARINQRKTEAHNTVSIDNLDSSEVWHSFRVARRAYPLNTEVRENFISSSHNGYKRDFKHRIHKRQWELLGNELHIKDSIEGSMDIATAHFFIHPLIKITLLQSNYLELKFMNEFICRIKWLNGDVTINDSFWYPEFGKMEKNKHIVVTFHTKNLTSIIELDK